MIETLYFSILFSAWALIWSFKLTTTGNIFHFVASRTGNWPLWIRKALYACEGCIAGQAAFWGYPGFCSASPFDYNPAYHFAIITLSIFFTTAIAPTYERITTQD